MTSFFNNNRYCISQALVCHFNFDLINMLISYLFHCYCYNDERSKKAKLNFIKAENKAQFQYLSSPHSATWARLR